MEKLGRLGRFLFAIAMAGFGVQFLVHAWLRGPMPGPPWDTGRPLWAYVTAGVLIVVAPLMILFMLFQRQFINSFLRSGLK